jgi:hypothetical protein
MLPLSAGATKKFIVFAPEFIRLFSQKVIPLNQGKKDSAEWIIHPDRPKFVGIHDSQSTKCFC